MFSLEGQTALVTGGTRGIGQAMAIALAEAGADVLLVQRSEENTSTRDQIKALGRQSSIYVADLASNDDLSSLVRRITVDGGHDIDILVNSGGIQRRHAAAEFPTSAWDEVMQVNLNAVFTLSRDVGAHMLARRQQQMSNGKGSQNGSSSGSSGGGVIINVASLLSFQGGWTVPAYAASKGGVAQLTKALSNEWAGRGVRVNAIAPGYIATDMNTALVDDPDRAPAILARIPAGRWGNPDDFRGAVVFLASRASAYVSGEILTVDGGWMGR